MLRKTMITTGIALALSAVANADYQAEIQGSYLTGDFDAGIVEADQDIWSLGGSYYLMPVNVDKGPLAEAAFLDRASDISANFSDGEIDGGFADADIQSYGISSRLVGDEGWLLELGYQNDEVEDLDSDTWSIGIGKYIAPNTTLTFNYANSDSDDFGDADIFGFDVEHVQLLANDQAVRLEAGYAMADPDNGDDADIWSVAGAFYFNRNISVNAGYMLTDSDDTELETFIIGGEWFINEQFAATLAYTESEDDEIGFDSDAVVIAGRFRF